MAGAYGPTGSTNYHVSILERIVMHLNVIKLVQIRLTGQRSHRIQDGILKPLLMNRLHGLYTRLQPGLHLGIGIHSGIVLVGFNHHPGFAGQAG